jgi:ABC-2 type transport system permease protein
MGAMQAASGPDQPFSTERIVNQAESQFAQAQTQSLVTVTRVEPGQMAEDARETNFLGVQVFVPGFAVLFIFLAAQTTARSIYDEKRDGTFRRLLAGPIGKSSLLAGKLLPNLILALIQFAVIFATAIFILPLVGLDRLDLGNDPLALVLLCVLVALCSTTLGILIAALAHTENQIGGLSTVLIWGAGILGGAMIPTFLLSDLLDKLGRVVPHYWAVDGFYQLFVLGGGLADIVVPLAALAAFALLFFAVGLWRFDYR